MKKLLSFIVLSLLWSNISYAELITLKDCYQFKDQTTGKFDTYEFKNLKEQSMHKLINYENLLFTLDTVTETITQTQVLKDSYIESMYKNNNYLMEKHQKLIFRITDLGGNVATAIADTKSHTENKIDVDFVSNKVFRLVKVNLVEKWTNRTIFQCKKQG
ncbi:hypothetical protein OAS12_01275 [Candidatus Pelagibacter ubique]|nr:hypothetical protein [Candidatus Pelagibacter ubique]